jgi:uncharacterized protein YerC
MPQVSRYPLDKAVEREVFQQFWESISKLKDSSDVSSFFSDILSDMEEIMLAKRFAVAVLILRGKSPVSIARTLHVSFSTVRSVASWAKNAKPQTRRVLNEMLAKGDWQRLYDRVDGLLDALPPRRGTDWSKAGKEKWQQKKKRSAREAVR